MNPNTVVLFDNFHSDNIKRIFSLDSAEQRYLYYTTTLHNDVYLKNYNGLIVYTTEDGEKISYSERNKRIYFNNKLYTRDCEVNGFTYHKKTGKIKIWFGGTLKSLKYLHLFFKHYKLEWVEQLNHNFLMWTLTPTLLGRIVSKKITNQKSYVQKWLATSLKTKAFPDTSKVLELMQKQINIGVGISLLYKFMQYTVNPMSSLDYFLEHRQNFDWHTTLIDVLNQAEILNIKINVRWSNSRLKQEHVKLTKQIVAMDKSINNVNLNYEGELQLPNNAKLLSTGLDVAEEGMIMEHCIYTNYWRSIKEYKYYAIHVTFKDVPYTIGIAYNNNCITNDHPIFYIDQIQGRRNMVNVPKELTDYYNNWIRDKNVQGFFAYNTAKHLTFKYIGLDSLAEQYEKEFIQNDINHEIAI